MLEVIWSRGVPRLLIQPASIAYGTTCRRASPKRSFGRPTIASGDVSEVPRWKQLARSASPMIGLSLLLAGGGHTCILD